jgi:ubiquinone/menaquinone biosynthesis C-methylase UbiE
MDGQLKNFYEKSDNYFEIISNQPKEYYNEFLEFVEYHLDKGSKIIDIGCGTGQSTCYLSELGYKVTGFDLSSRFIDYAKKKYTNLDFINGESNKIDFSGDEFDAVASYNTFEHFLNIEESLKEMIRIVKKNGLIIIQAPNLLSLKYPINALKNKGLTFEGQKNFLELFLMFWRNFYWLSKKRILKKYSLKHRLPILDFNYPDNDATSFLNPYDLKLLLENNNCTILSYQGISHISKKNFLKALGCRFFPDAMGIIRIVARKNFT